MENKTLAELRLDIDDADRRLLEAFTDRMRVSAAIARYKKEQGLPVYDPDREQDKLRDVAGRLPAELREEGKELYALLFALSKRYQERVQERDENPG